MTKTKILDENDWVPISALQHYSYCPRQCALIYVEKTFDENLYTLRGRAVHSLVDMPKSTMNSGIRVEYSLPLYNECLGLVGKADVVEFHGSQPYPVEYKHGKLKPQRQRHDEIQLAAQALCLEEMTQQDVSQGAIFYHSSRHRHEVFIDNILRAEVKRIIPIVRSLLKDFHLPSPVNDSRCRHCSLKDACQPKVLTDKKLKNIEENLFTLEDD